MGRPALPPGSYFRMLLIGYFEGIDSERGIAWRAADSLALRDFLGSAWTRAPPDHSTHLADPPADRPGDAPGGLHLGAGSVLAEQGLLKGKTIGVDATTLEANAAMRQHRAARHGRELPGVPDAAGAGVGHRDADAGGPGAARPQAEEQGLERRLGEPARSGREDHQDEGRPHAPGAQGRARGGPWRRARSWR